MKRISSALLLVALVAGSNATGAQARLRGRNLGGGKACRATAAGKRFGDAWCQASCASMVAAYPTLCENADGPPPDPVDGGWSAFGECSAKCGSGTKTRACTSPAPAHGGKACAGKATAPCDSGVKCTGPSPAPTPKPEPSGKCDTTCDAGCEATALGKKNWIRDKSCERCATGYQFWPCNNEGWCACKAALDPVDGKFGEWGACSKECGGGTQTRTCDAPAPAHGGKACEGATRQACNTQVCPESPLGLPTGAYNPKSAAGTPLRLVVPSSIPFDQVFPSVPKLAFLSPDYLKAGGDGPALAGEIADQGWRDNAPVETVQGYVRENTRNGGGKILFDGTALGAPVLPLEAYKVVAMAADKAEADERVQKGTGNPEAKCEDLAKIPEGQPGHDKNACLNYEQFDRLRLKDASQLEGLLSDKQHALMQERGQLEAIRDSLTSADAAETLFWEHIAAPAAGALPIYLHTLLKRVGGGAAVDGLLKTLAATDAQKARYAALAAAGKLYAMDALSSAALPKRAGPSKAAEADTHTVGALVLLERHNGFAGQAMRPIHIKLLAEAPADGTARASADYTRAGSTESAWAQAIYFATTAIQNWGVWNGHVLNLHVIPAALTWTIRNTMAPSHPIRTMYEDRSGDNLSLLTIFASGAIVDGTPTVVKNMQDILVQVQAGGMPKGTDNAELEFPREYEPVVQAAKNGLLESDFSGKKAAWWQAEAACGKDAWKDFPLVAAQQKVWDVAKKYVATFVDAVYADDAAVAGDVQLQAWVKSARVDANLKTLKDVTTRAALKDLLTFVVYTPLTHTFSTTDAVLGSMFHAGVFHPQVMTAALPDATESYDEAYYLKNVLPTAYAMKRLGGFVGAFMYAGINDRLIPASGELDTQLEFPTLAKAHPVNVAQVNLRRDMIDTMDYFIDNYNRGFCAAYATAAQNAKAAGQPEWAECKAASIARLTENTSW